MIQFIDLLLSESNLFTFTIDIIDKIEFIHSHSLR